VTRRLSYLEAELGRLAGLRRRLGDTQVLFDGESENDEPTRPRRKGELAALRAEIDQLEVRTLLNGEYDAREALISINARQGGDAANFAEKTCCGCTCAGRSGTSTRPSVRHLYAEEAGIKSTRSR